MSATLPAMTREGSLPATELLFESFTTLSEVYPQHLAGVTAALGTTALRLIGSGELTYDEFIGSQLTGPHLDRLVQRTVELHEGVGFTRHDSLASILPFVYELAKASVASSTYELFAEDRGVSHNSINLDALSPSTSSLVAGKIEAESGAPNRILATALFAAATTSLLDRPSMTVGDHYRDALTHKSSPFFPAAHRRHIGEKRERLTHYLRPILFQNILSAARHYDLPEAHARVFTHNISRPA